MPKGNNKINFLLLRLEELCVLKKSFFKFSSNCCCQFLLQHKYLFSFKSSLKFVYSGKLIFNSISLTYFIIMSLFTVNSMKSFRKTIDKIW